MGTTFRYIADAILRDYAETGDTCPCCERAAELYRIYVGDPASDRYAENACVTCIRTLPLRWINPKDDERRCADLVNKRFPKGTKSQEERFAFMVETCDEYRRTPWLPNFIQRVDWPDCCGDFAEFIGDAGRTYRGPYDGFEWWGSQDDLAVGYGIQGMLGGEDRVSLFRCPTCKKGFWTLQTT